MEVQGAQLTRAEVRHRLTTLLSEIAGIPTGSISDSATVEHELQMQSVAFIELQVAIEEEYNTAIDPIRIVELNEFGAIVDYVYQCAMSGLQ